MVLGAVLDGQFRVSALLEVWLLRSGSAVLRRSPGSGDLALNRAGGPMCILIMG